MTDSSLPPRCATPTIQHCQYRNQPYEVDLIQYLLLSSQYTFFCFFGIDLNYLSIIFFILVDESLLK
jgi:hypothetical protein